jgi:hypothetical protein
MHIRGTVFRPPVHCRIVPWSCGPTGFDESASQKSERHENRERTNDKQKLYLRMRDSSASRLRALNPRASPIPPARRGSAREG